MPNPNLQTLASDPAVRRIMEVVRQGGGEARIVGGAVRDVLLGRAVGEIDLAATLPPEQAMALLAKAGIKTVPTGIDFGTITAVIDGTGYEITTLRHDVETDGRHAKVAYTDDWQADAARRDFTMNALYLDADGRLYDYFDGQADLAAGHVRFIGDAAQRIREDVLRILRFFRFYAWFGRGAVDAEGLAACRDLAGLIPQLSVERVWNEIKKLLAAENPAPGWRLMLDAGILAEVLPEARDVARLESLLAVETRYEVQASSLRRLAGLLSNEISRSETGQASLPRAGGAGGGQGVNHPSQRSTFLNQKSVPDSETFPMTQPPCPPPTPPASGRGARMATAIAERLKFSKKETAKLQSLTTLPVLLHGKLDPVPFRRALYEHGAENVGDAALLLAAANPALDLDTALAAAAAWERPAFPLQGQDLLKLGMKPGPEMGTLLRTLEEKWIASDFKLTREECLAATKKEISLT